MNILKVIIFCFLVWLIYKVLLDAYCILNQIDGVSWLINKVLIPYSLLKDLKDSCSKT